jgi:hypothetical protein
MNAPKRIWLQWEDHLGESTWCADPINDEDVEYVRADLHDTLRAERDALAARIERLEGALEFYRDEWNVERVFSNSPPAKPSESLASDMGKRAHAALSTARDG